MQQRTVEHRIVEQTVDVPTPQILEEIVDTNSAPHEQMQQRTVEQQIVDAVPHSQPQISERGRRGGEGSQKMSLRSVFQRRTVNRSTTTFFPSINQVTKLAATHRPVGMQRKVPQIRTVLKTVELRRIRIRPRRIF